MVKYEVFRNREVLVMLFSGVALVLFFILFYIDLWKPRKTKNDDPEQTEIGYLSVWEGIPWTIKVISVIIIFAMTAYIVYLFMYPTDW